MKPSDVVHLVTIGDQTYKVRDSQTARKIWTGGDGWTFSNKEIEHLHFLEAAGKIAVQKSTQIEDKKQETDRVHTEEYAKRAKIRADGQREIERIKIEGKEVRRNLRNYAEYRPPDKPFLSKPCPLGHTPTNCLNHPCDRRGQCRQEGILGEKLEFDSGGISEQYIRSGIRRCLVQILTSELTNARKTERTDCVKTFHLQNVLSVARAETVKKCPKCGSPLRQLVGYQKWVCSNWKCDYKSYEEPKNKLDYLLEESARGETF